MEEKKKEANIPEECSKDDGSDTAAPEGTVADPPFTAPPCSHGNKCGKPEYHRDKLDTGNGILMGGSREAARGDDQVGDNEKGPDGGEEHEGDASWYPGNVCIDDWDMISTGFGNTGLVISHTICAQAKDNDAEKDLDATKAHEDSGSDHVGDIKQAMDTVG
jgi:hypothetical protein